MPDNEFTTVSTSLLPLDDLYQYLYYKYGLVIRGENATDVDKVGGVAAHQIAVAVDPSDRETIKNALELGGIPAKDYVTMDVAGQIMTSYNKVKSTYSDEIKDLRDELYQLRTELAKSGVTTNYNHYAGFHDLFRDTDIVHLKSAVTIAQQDSATHDEVIILDTDFDKFDVGDYIMLDIKDQNVRHVAHITEKLADGITLKFTPSTTVDIKANMVDVYKSNGEVQDGAYCFLKSATNLPDSRDQFSGLDDDTFRLRRQVKSSDTGFGYSFRIPETLKGFLKSLSITAKTYGNPGALMCYIVDERDVEKFKNPTQAERDNILLAKSQPLTLDASYGERIITFNFWDGNAFPLLNEADTVDHKVRYTVIVKALQADDDNYYDILFLQNKHTDGSYGDLQLNNTTYNYVEREDTSLNLALTTDADVDAADMFYTIITRGVVNNGFTPLREGIYTARTSTVKPIEVSTARLTLRVNREGYYTTNLPKASIYPNDSTLPVQKEAGLGDDYDLAELAGFGFGINSDKIVIGKEIRNISNQNSSGIVLSNGMYAEPNTPVYRCGYKAYLKAWHKVWDEAKCEYNILDYARIELPLEFVMPDRIKHNPKISDRLVFENEFLDEEANPRMFNEFELQIYWNTNYGGFYESDKYKYDFVGKVHDLVLSLDRSI